MLSPDLIRVETVIEYDFHQINLIVLCAIKKKITLTSIKKIHKKSLGYFFLIFLCVAPLFILPFFK